MRNLIVLFVVVLTSFIVTQVEAQSATKSIAAAQYYEGGQEPMYKFINDHKVYPVNAKKNRIQGECIIHLQIDANGTIAFASIVTNIGAGCGAEALRVVKLLKFNAPGYKVDANIPVYFKL